MKKIILAFVIIFIGAVLVAVSFYFLFLDPTSKKIILNNHTLHVLVANTPEERYRGLSDRHSLSPYDGMLFTYIGSLPNDPVDPSFLTIVMREMNFPIDIVWVSRGIIVDIVQNAPPERGVDEDKLRRFESRVPAQVIIELPVGGVQKYGLKIGSEVSL